MYISTSTGKGKHVYLYNSDYPFPGINPKAASTITVQTFKDWKLQCDVKAEAEAEAEKNSCNLLQTAGLKALQLH